MHARPSAVLLTMILCAAPAWPAAAQSRGPNGPPSYDDARRSAWTVANVLVESLQQGDTRQSPGTQAWIKDFREQTRGIDPRTPPAQWPKVDIAKLVDHNPDYWGMVFEIVPGDPAVTLLHASLLLSQGEAKRAAYVIEIGKHWPGMPQDLSRAMEDLQNTALGALEESNGLTQAGIKLFDEGNYEGAMKKFREALALAPTNGWTWYEIGYTLRTQAAVARGDTPAKPGTFEINKGFPDSPEVIAALAAARRHDPLQLPAWQGTDPAVIQALPVLAKQVVPAFKALNAAGEDAGGEFRALNDLSKGLSEAGIHDLAIPARQLMVARRNSYDPSDFPIIAAGLRRLAPGDESEKIVARLAGERLSFRSWTQQEPEEGQPAIGSDERLAIPEKAPPKKDAENPVRLEHIRLLTPEDDVARRTTIEELTKFVKEAQKISEEVLGKSPAECKVLLEFECRADGHTVEIRHQPVEVDATMLGQLHERLMKLGKAGVKEGTVEFQLQLDVDPKRGGK